MTATKIRKSIPLEPADLTRVGNFDTDEILQAVAARHAGIGVAAIKSEAVLMRILVRAGLDALEQEADEERYARLATTQDDEDRQFHAAMRLRRS